VLTFIFTLADMHESCLGSSTAVVADKVMQASAAAATAAAVTTRSLKP
jgi:hypothetical protein